MIVIMKHSASAKEIGEVVAYVESLGCKAHISSGE